MRSQDEINSVLASRGLNTVRFQAFLFEARELDSPFHDQVARLETAAKGELDKVLTDVELAYKVWMSHD
jgi:hypothetical protein